MTKPTLYLMFGYPGAGKTTTAKMIHKLTGAEHLSSDIMRMKLFAKPKFTQLEHDQLYHELDYRTERFLGEGKDVIYDANLNRYKHRKDKYDICERTGASCVLLWVKATKELARERAVHDSRQHLWPPGETPGAMFDRIADIIELPRDDEPYIEVDGTRITEEYIGALLNEAPK